VDLDRQFRLVSNALRRNDISTLLLGWCQNDEIESWSFANEEEKSKSKGKIISHFIEGKKVELEESMPYFCFIGADIIDYLWRMAIPNLETPPGEYERRYRGKYEYITLDQLKNLHGVYHFSFDDNNYEGHGYIWYIWRSSRSIYRDLRKEQLPQLLH